MNRKIIIAVTGASGSIYAKLLIDKLLNLSKYYETVDLIFSKNAKDVWAFEMGNKDYESYPFKIYEPKNLFSGPASGSANYSNMIICPASMGTIGRIAAGVSDDLISRAADVMLKERKQLILVPRETPYNLIHLRNLTSLTEAGAIILPASPSFYSKPKNIEELAETVVDRIIQLIGISNDSYRWKG